MTHSEQIAFDALTEEGWTVLKRGLPDFFCYKRNKEGELQIAFVEVKAGEDKLSPYQGVILCSLLALRSLDHITAAVARVLPNNHVVYRSPVPKDIAGNDNWDEPMSVEELNRHLLTGTPVRGARRLSEEE